MYSRVYVEITNICNMNCSFCHGHKRPAGKMTREGFSRILQSLRGKTDYIYYHLMGEPLTHPELPDFLEMAAVSGYRSVITTNGTLLGKRGKQLLEKPLHKVNVSLHSFETGTQEDHFAYLEDVAAFADRANEKDVLVSLRLWNEGCDDGKNDLTLAFLKNRLPGAWTPNTRGYRIREKCYIEWGDRFAWPDKEAPKRDREVACYGLRDHFGILCDGTVVPCCLDSDGVIDLGNIYQQPIDEILNSDRATAMAEGFRCRKATEDLCRRCGYARRF